MATEAVVAGEGSERVEALRARLAELEMERALRLADRRSSSDEGYRVPVPVALAVLVGTTLIMIVGFGLHAAALLRAPAARETIIVHETRPSALPPPTEGPTETPTVAAAVGLATTEYPADAAPSVHPPVRDIDPVLVRRPPRANPTHGARESDPLDFGSEEDVILGIEAPHRR